jgi:DNA end-binding protein Ku
MTSRSIWNGKLTFGLVSIPIRVHSATEDSGPQLHDVHMTDGGRIGLRRYCKDCGEDVDEVGKGHETPDGMICFSPAELKTLRPHIEHEARVMEFVDPVDIPTEMYGALYYLSPQAPERRPSRNSVKPVYNASHVYSLLAETLRRTGTVAVVTIALRQKECRAFIYVQENMLVMRTLLWADQVREPACRPHNRDFDPAELSSSVALVEAMTSKFDPSKHVNPYAERLATLIAERMSA